MYAQRAVIGSDNRISQRLKPILEDEVFSGAKAEQGDNRHARPFCLLSQKSKGSRSHAPADEQNSLAPQDKAIPKRAA